MSRLVNDETSEIALIADLITHVTRSGFEDWSIINQICDLALTNEDCALQANLTLAEELNGDASDHRLLRVARLWALMLRNCGYLFIEYNVSSASGFLDALEEMLSIKMVTNSGSGSSERFLRVLGAAVYDISKTDIQHPYSRLWAKFKHPGQPLLGSRIPDSDALLRPPAGHSAPNTPSTSRMESHSAIRRESDPSSSSRSTPPTISVQEAGAVRGWDPYANSRNVQDIGAATPSRPKYPTHIIYDAQSSNSSSSSSSARARSSSSPFRFVSSSPFNSNTPANELLATPYSDMPSSSSTPPPMRQAPRKRSFRKSMVDSLRTSLDKVYLHSSSGDDHHNHQVVGSQENFDDFEVVVSPDESNVNLPSFPTGSRSYTPVPSTMNIPIPSTSSPISPTSSTSASSDIFSVLHSSLDPSITLNMTISDLCHHIRNSSRASQSRITLLVWNKESSGVKHEFLLIKVVSPSDEPAVQEDGRAGDAPRKYVTWMRLDRAARKGYTGIRNFGFRSSSAVFPANDTAMLSGSNKSLFGGDSSRVQAQMGFHNPPTLVDLQTLLTVISEESAEYDLFKENCYFFCSIIQQLLAEFHQGMILQGKVLHQTLGQDARRRITLRLRGHSIPYTMPS